MRAARFNLFLLGLIALLLALAAAINGVVDPLQVLRRATWYAPHFSTNQRYQAPGLARYYVQPIVVAGTSHVENMLPSDVQHAFGEAAVNLAISGSSLREQELALSLALNTQRVHRVLWAIDYSALTWGDVLTEGGGEFPDYLYHFDPRLVSRYLLSLQTLDESRKALTEPPEQELDSLNAWWNRFTFGRDRILAAWQYQERRWTPELHRSTGQKFVWANLEPVLEKRVFATIRAHPEVGFDLVLPPYSMLMYANDFRIADEYFFQRVLMRDVLRRFASTQANVRLWDFQTRTDISEDFSRYKDLEHFGLDINREMLSTIASGSYSAPDGGPDPLPQQLADFLRPYCSKGTRDAGGMCPGLVACGYARLQQWLDAGARLEEALEAGHRPCMRN